MHMFEGSFLLDVSQLQNCLGRVGGNNVVAMGSRGHLYEMYYFVRSTTYEAKRAIVKIAK